MSKKKIDDKLQDLKKGFFKFLDPETEQSDQSSSEDEHAFDFEEDDNSDFRFNAAISKRVKNVVNDFIDAAPLIEQAGFRISDLEIELSVIPKLIPHFKKIADVDDSIRVEIIEQVKDKRLIRLLLKALFKADNFQKSFNVGRLEFSGIEIEITAIPAIRLRYKNLVELDPEFTSTKNDLV